MPVPSAVFIRLIHFCLLVGTILGTHCFSSPSSFYPPGDCTDTGDILICHVHEYELPLLVSWYDPFIETDDPHVAAIQCQDPCDQLGDGTPVEEGYGRYAACVLGWYGRWLYLPEADVYKQCRDHGGAIRLTCGYRAGVYSCWIPIDMLEKQTPWYAHQFREWQAVDLVDVKS